MGQHLVNQGECVASIAAQHHIDWHRIWDHANNAGLRALRKNPNVLFPGDLVFVPGSDKTYPVATGQAHVFAVERAKAQIRLRLLEGGDPIAGLAYELSVDGVQMPPGVTDGAGCLEAWVPQDAVAAEVTIPAHNHVFLMKLGVLDPITETTGLQARLKQLGYYRGDIDGVYGDDLAIAVWGFQVRHGLDASGKPDDAMRAALESDYWM